eukprot:6488603-Lingulodinium_polyedra.AAC.1
MAKCNNHIDLVAKEALQQHPMQEEYTLASKEASQMDIIARYTLLRSVDFCKQWQREPRRKKKQGLPRKARPVPAAIQRREDMVSSHK